VAVRRPIYVSGRETATKSAPLQKHSPGGCTMDRAISMCMIYPTTAVWAADLQHSRNMPVPPSSNCHRRGGAYRFAAIRTIPYHSAQFKATKTNTSSRARRLVYYWSSVSDLCRLSITEADRCTSRHLSSVSTASSDDISTNAVNTSSSVRRSPCEVNIAATAFNSGADSINCNSYR